MEKNFSFKQFFLRYFVFIILVLSLFVNGCGDGSGSSSSVVDDGSDDKIVTSEFTGSVIFSDDAGESEVSVYDADGDALVFVDASDAKQTLAETTSVSTSGGSFTFRFKKDAYSYPFLLMATKGDKSYFSIFGKDKTKMNINEFTTSLVMDLAGLTSLVDLISDPGAYIKNTSGNNWLNYESFYSKAKESFDETTLDELLGGNYSAFSENAVIKKIIAKIKVYSDKNLKTASISGVVKSFNSREALSGVTVSSSLVFSSTVTDENGLFVLEGVPASGDVPLNFSKKGYTSNLEIFSIDSNAEEKERTSAVETFLKAVTTSETKTVAQLRDALSDSADSGIPFTIASKDNSIKIKMNLKNRQLLGTRGILADDSQSVTFEMTSVDPTSEREVFPGDFSAENSNKETLEDTEQETTLESVVLADMSMYDADGNELQLSDLTLDSVLIEMKIPDNLQQQYKEAYELGIRTIPWWAFNEDTGKWEREGEAELFVINDVMYGRAKATHFSWWNIDWPIETHAVICGYVTGADSTPVAGAQVVAKGVDYQGNSYATTNKDGFYQLKVKKDSQVKLSASYGAITANYPEVINVNWDKNTYCDATEIETCCADGNEWRKDISLTIIKISGTVKDSQGNVLEGAIVKASNGGFGYTDSEGKYSIKTGAGVKLNLKASYIKNNIKASAEKNNVEVGQESLENVDFELDIAPYKISGAVKFQKTDGTQIAMAGVEILGANGQFTVTDVNGLYSIYADKKAASLIITYKAFLPSGIYGQQQQTITFDGTSEYTASDIIFIEKEAFIKGSVVDSQGNALKGIEVQSNFGKISLTDVNGKFQIRVPVDSKASATAYYNNAQLEMSVEEDSLIVNIPADGGTFSVGQIVLEIRPAYIKGKVTNKDTGVGLPGVKVFTEFGGSAVTDSSGNYKVQAPVNKDDVKVFFSYESFNEDGQRTRWADPLEKTVDTLSNGQEVTLNAVLELTSYPPVITSINAKPLAVAPGGTVTLSVSAFDPDNDALTYSWLKDGNVIGTSSSVTYTFPSATVTGSQSFKVVVSDGKKSVSRNVEVFVQENRSPVIFDSWIIPTIGAPGETIKAFVKAYDLDGDDLSYTWSWKTGAEFAGVDLSSFTSNEISFTAPFTAVSGTYTLNVTVSDGSNNTSTEISFNIVENRPPEIVGFSAVPYKVISGGSSKLTVFASDPDSDSLTYEWENKNTGEVVKTDSKAEYVWTSPADITEETEYEFVVTVSDNNNPDVSQSVFIIVVPEDTTDPDPSLSGKVAGYIKDASGNPISQAAVRIYSAFDDGASLDQLYSTGSDGYYEFLDIPPGQYYVVVGKDGYVFESKLINVN